MDVTKMNFEVIFPDIQKALLSEDCKFVSIDTEFTGLQTSEDERNHYMDTLEERYKKHSASGNSFVITQFGLSTIHDLPGDEYKIQTWNFYVFPPAKEREADKRFLCQASSMSFLSKHGFDFNKWISEGLPYVNHLEEISLREGLEKRTKKRRQQFNNPQTVNLSASDKVK